MTRPRIKVTESVKTENRLKIALYYSIELLVDVLIIYFFIKGFTTSFSFAYDVFHDSAMNPGTTKYVVVEIDPESSTSKICEKLYDAGVIRNKYVMMVRIKVGEYGKKIKAGKYGLSASMTYDEIIRTICGEKVDKGENLTETGTTGKEDVASDTDAYIDPSKVIDNSDKGAGAGGGAEESGEQVEDDFGVSGEDSSEGNAEQ